MFIPLCILLFNKLAFHKLITHMVKKEKHITITNRKISAALKSAYGGFITKGVLILV
jgi:hypothetical protein